LVGEIGLATLGEPYVALGVIVSVEAEFRRMPKVEMRTLGIARFAE
jgi:hypothetical protein